MMDFPLHFKRGLKSIWAEAARGKKPSLEASETLLMSPFRNGDSLREILTYLTLQSMGHIAPPVIPRITPMPVAELCQLVLLWAIAGEYEAASALAYSIPLDFPWMWTKENEYSEAETLASIGLLSEAMERSYEDISMGDPYFQTLANNLSLLPPPRNENPVLDWTRLIGDDFECCLTFTGSRTSLGSFLTETAEIRAFGPQSFPLSNSLGFGIRMITQHGNRWASMAARPEVWFETKARLLDSKGLLLDLSFFGLAPNAPLVFSFYVKAEDAQIGAEIFKPKTLQRYQGTSKPLTFSGGLTIESLIPGKMELIPLAGSGGYWDCEYLAAFEIHPVNAKMSFSIRTNP
jgi:hypothetical protein